METKVKNKQTCYYCIHNRPRKKDLCSIHGIYVSDIHAHTCENFEADPIMLRIEDQKPDDEGSKRFFYLNFNLYICS